MALQSGVEGGMGKRKEPKTAERACAVLAARQAGNITRAQAKEAGLSLATLDHRSRTGSWPRMQEGVYRILPVEQPWFSEVAAAALAVEGAAIGACAAGVWGFDGFKPEGPIQVATGNGRRLQGRQVYVSRGGWFTPEMVTRRNGVPVLQPLWTLLTLGDFCSRDAVEGVLDDCLRRGFTNWDELQQATQKPFPANHKGSAVMRELLTLRAQRQHTHSYLETRMLQLMRNAGLPQPTLQYLIPVGEGVEVHADFGFPDRRVLVETVGMKGHCSELWQYASDCRRNNAVSLLDRYIVLQYTWKQVVGAPETVVTQLASALGVPVQEPFRILERRGGPALLALPLR